jgi:MFS family permease
MAAGTISVVGSWMQVAAQGWVVLRLTGSSAALGLSVSLQAVPSLLFGRWGGVLADRIPRRLLLMLTQGAHALFALALAALAATGQLSVGVLLVVALLTGVIGATEGPANGAIAAELVETEDMPNAIALGGVSNSLGRIVGMAAAGIVLGIVGPTAAFVVNALSFVPVLVVLRTLPVGEPAVRGERENAWADLVEGMRAVRRHTTLLLTLLVAFVLGASGRNYQVTMAVMAADVFHRGAGGYALLSTAFAVGALLGGVIAAQWGRSGFRSVLAVGAAGATLQLLGAVAPSMHSFAAVIVGIGAMAVLFDTVVAAHVQVSADSSMRGRVLGAATAASAASGVVGAPALGGLAQLLNGRAALGVGGAICLTTIAVATNVYAGRANIGGPIDLLRRARSRRADRAAAPAPLSASAARNG